MAFFDPRRRGYLTDPYPSLAALRKQDPVHWSGDFRAWVSTRYADCAEILHDSRRFTSDPTLTVGARAEAITTHRESAPLGRVQHLGTTSGEAHRKLRQLVNPVFAPTAAHRAEAGMAVLVESSVGELPAGVPFDYMGAFANQLPRRALAATIGCPSGEEDTLQRALTTIETTRSNPGLTPLQFAAAEAASRTATTLLERHMGGRLPADTVLGALMPPVGQNLSIEEVTSVAAQIATVGADPTSGALGNALAALATRPAVVELLRAEPQRLHSVVHELLRFDSPSHIIPRFATVNTELGGKHIRRGDTVFAMVGAANRDPEVFADPDELDIDRDARRQLSFGQGEHICLGALLALSILELALASLLRRFERIELTAEPEYGRSIQLRVPERLMLRCS